MNNRRKLIVALGAGALAAPFASFAQQPAKVARIAFLGAASATAYASRVEAVRSGLRALGYVEGKNVTIEWRFLDGTYERLSGLAAELVQLKPDVIVAASTPSVEAVRQATSTIPIVMVGAGDPVSSGFVASLSRPGGNITGLTNVSGEISAKYVELLREVIPKLSRVAVLMNNSSSHLTILKTIQSAANKTGVKVIPVEARTSSQIEAGMVTIAREHAEALIVMADTFFLQQSDQIAALSIKYRLATMLPNPTLVEAGGLMSYGWNATDSYRRVAIYVDKILKGAKPADLPVEQPTKFELVVNMKTAKALGLTIPQSILVRADRAIE